MRTQKTILFLLALTFLSACGVKPSSLKPPADAPDTYNRSYPAPEEDTAQ